MKRDWKKQLGRIFVTALAVAGALQCAQFASRAGGHIARAADPWLAICPVVYPLDEVSAERGYRYIFYGNAFFINRQGYLLTAAHVLSDFQNGAHPRILVRLREAPPKLLNVELVAADSQHDVAILRAIPNPFEGRYEVAILALSANKPTQQAAVLVAALRPTRLKDPHSFDAPQEDQSRAAVLEYTSIRLNKGQPECELFLFDHEVIRGQSGAPVLLQDNLEVIGFVEGQWLHGMPLGSVKAGGNTASTLGAGVPIGYAIPLLEKEHVSWQSGVEASK